MKAVLVLMLALGSFSSAVYAQEDKPEQAHMCSDKTKCEKEDKEKCGCKGKHDHKGKKDKKHKHDHDDHADHSDHAGK